MYQTKDHFKAKSLSALAILAVAMLLCFSPLAAHAASATLSVTTNQASFPAGNNTIQISGNVTPAPSVSGTYVGISIISPNGALSDANQFLVNPATGSYNGTFKTGGPTYTSSGIYTVKAVYDNSTASTTFQYGNSTSTSSSQSGTTIVSGTTTTTTVAESTTLTEGGTTTTVVSSGAGTTVTSIITSATTIVSNVTSNISNNTGLAIGAVAIVIAIIAAVMAIVAMRRK